MYKFPYYTEADTEKVIAFMQKVSFAAIIGGGDEYPVATHIPLELERKDGKILLSGHLMKKTDHHLAFTKNEQVLVIFNGPHAHISASWYTNPAMGSTWNYMVVHAKGRIRFTDEEGTYEAVKRITNKYESAESAASFDKLPQDYIDSMVKAIAGFTIEVESIDNTFKLNQNRDAESQQNIIAELKKRGDYYSKMVAEEMEKRRPEVPPAH